MRPFLVAAFVLFAARGAAAAPALVPAPLSYTAQHCAPLALDRPLRAGPHIDAGGLDVVRERWSALGIPPPGRASRAQRATVVVRRTLRTNVRGAYALSAGAGGVTIDVAPNDDGDGAFNALATLAQLPERGAGTWSIACASVRDEPAMAWRVVSDDVSRGPFPTMRYARERIRTLASLKINGWSPYMEMVVVDPRYPYVAWPNGWTAQQLRELTDYGRRYHVTLIPEQQTFAHMHESLKWETLAPHAELPHGYLFSESDPGTYAYLEPLVRTVAAATRAPFVHLGSDEPVDLGRGRTPRTPQVFADHVTRVASFLAGTGARPMIWDDALQQDKTIMPLLPRDTVVVTWHYGAEKTFRPYIDAIRAGGFDQFVAPGASNWNEIYPDLANAYPNIGRMIADGRGAPGVLGMFMTVWHDDGETLYEATWPALAYAAASAWQRAPVEDAAWHRTFARAFFGDPDGRIGDDLDALREIRTMLRTTPGGASDYTYWRDPFDPALQARAAALDLAGIRTRAEAVAQHLWDAPAPLHPEAARVMKLAALRYDQLARRLQIGKEARDDYDDARAHAGKPNETQVYRSLATAKYLCWEMRDAQAFLEPLYAAAWRYENTEPGLERYETRTRIAREDAQRCADRIDGVMREGYLRHGAVPPWNEVMPSAR